MAFKPWLFQDGNNAYEKFKTPEARLDVYERYCKHLAEGNSVDSFPDCGENTIERMMKKYADELPPDLMRRAVREGKRFWEAVGKHGTIGIPNRVNGKDYDKFNAKSYQFIMMNKYGEVWREQTTSAVTVNTNEEAKQYEDELRQLSEAEILEHQQLLERANNIIKANRLRRGKKPMEKQTANKEN